MILPRLVFSVWFLWFRSALPLSLFLSLSWENRFNPRRDVQPSGRLSGFDAKHRMGINNAWAGHFTLFRCSRPFAGRVAPIKETAFRRVNFITMLDNHSFGWSSDTSYHLEEESCFCRWKVFLAFFFGGMVVKMKIVFAYERRNIHDFGYLGKNDFLKI